jgi:hypothetical protein
MIRFEYCDTPAARGALAEAKARSPAVVSAETSEIAANADDAFSLEMEEQGMAGKPRKGRPKKFRGSPN